MGKVSVIIPSRNESLLSMAVESVRKGATEETEIIVILDGPTQYSVPGGVRIIQHEEPLGLNASIDAGIAAASGEYIFKLDSHCTVMPGFDRVLKGDCDKDWLVIPRRYHLDLETGLPTTKEHGTTSTVDYFYFNCPWTYRTRPPYMAPKPWYKRTRARKDIFIDETMAIHGSAWFAHTSYCRDILDNLNRKDSWGDANAVPLRVWLGGGKVMVNKKVWYTHIDDRTSREKRGYTLGGQFSLNRAETMYWINNKWERRVHDFDWLVERFWPLPLLTTVCNGEKFWWPEDWRKYYGN